MARSSPPLVGRVASGELRTPATQTLPLAEAAEAHRLLETGQTTGKLVLKPRSAGPALPAATGSGRIGGAGPRSSVRPRCRAPAGARVEGCPAAVLPGLWLQRRRSLPGQQP
ncbi:zinc-binding dehydrogenase [Streptomyces mirabilis]|uniref:zinc-binding dehydrogenase n=1 Tax=Streptomyces mirabilis TaxID=68239 RepID=UPI003BEED756